jgi:MoCo/4Fe-4S cofactor protein with predicted Tat translocation signal
VSSPRETPFDLDEARRRLAGRSGRSYWRSLEELAGSEGFEAWLRRAYPSQVHRFMDPPSRREALKLMAASLALAGATSCTRQPKETIVPYARSPEATVPGVPLYFATAMPWPSGAIGLLVESHMGRPTKVEGNPDHPASLGSTDAFAQASVLSLYDPDRTQVVQRRGRISTWDAFLTEVRSALAEQEPKHGAGLRLLLPTVISPTLARRLDALVARLPAARWHQWDPVNRDNSRRAALQTFGRDAQPRHRFDRADVVVSLGADFLGGGPESVRSMRDFTERRKIREGREKSRLYAVETAPTITGAMADHRRAVRPSEVQHIAYELHRALAGEQVESLWVRALARDLGAHRGTSLVVAGREQPADVHRLAHVMNARLDNVGRSVVYTEPVDLRPVTQIDSLRELVADMRKGAVDVLAVLGGNPVYDAPADFDFASALAEVPLKIHLGDSADETSQRCDWHIPRTSYLEAWGDARAADGTVTIVQPLIAPLYLGRSELEVVGALSGEPLLSAYDAVRETWKGGRADAEFERWWRRAVHDGIVPDTAFPILDVRPSGQPIDPPPAAGEGIQIAFRPDPTTWDGRFANNGWLQELPKPLTKLTWDNAALVGPQTAGRLELASQDVVELSVYGRTIHAPVWVLPGHAEGALTVHLGYGRSVCGHLGRGAGFDAYALRTSGALDAAAEVAVRRTGERRSLVSTQEHDSMEGRDIVRASTVRSFRENPKLFEREDHGGLDTSMYPAWRDAGYAWGMVIDLNACTGCNACVVACQAENNIPIVGKREVERGREMHWIRIDRYFAGDPEEPAVHHQPVPCMHCENAPCEVVCPVNATVHSAEGLNQMVYNRCVGTRYCSNNCPYKVRRFNFFHYADYDTESLKLQRNPDVTVRSRGVMEKCTYCVQRINAARIEAEKQGRPIRDGEARTACQQVCPARAIAFGDLNDAESEVARLKRSELEYGLLEELNTRPRTTYLAKLMNPNPEVQEGRGS